MCVRVCVCVISDLVHSPTPLTSLAIMQCIQLHSSTDSFITCILLVQPAVSDTPQSDGDDSFIQQTGWTGSFSPSESQHLHSDMFHSYVIGVVMVLSLIIYSTCF